MSFLFVLEFTLTPHFFREFNLLMRIYLNAATGAEGDQLLRGVLSSVSLTDSQVSSIGSAKTVRDAIKEYNIGILQRLARFIRRRDALQRQDDVLDEELFSTFTGSGVTPFGCGSCS